MDAKNEVIRRIRQVIPSRNELGDLNDSQLWELFLRWRSGHSTRSIAVWAHETLNPHRSIESWRVSLKRFHKRIAPILIGIPQIVSGPPQTSNRSPLQFTRPEYAQNDEIARLNVQIQEADALLRSLRAEYQQTGICPKDLSKLEQSLSALVKTKLKMEAAARNYPPDTRIPPERAARIQAKWIRVCDMIDVDLVEQAIDDFLLECEKHVCTLEIAEDGSASVRPITESERIQDLSLGICGGLSAKSENPRGG